MALIDATKNTYHFSDEGRILQILLKNSFFFCVCTCATLLNIPVKSIYAKNVFTFTIFFHRGRDDDP